MIDDAACNGAGTAMLLLKFKNRASISNQSCKHCQKNADGNPLGSPTQLSPPKSTRNKVKAS